MEKISPRMPGLAPNHNDTLSFMDAHTIMKVDQALRKVGDFGEVKLIVVKGQLRFIQITQSESLKGAN